jgi:hypothetical protein
LTCQRFLTDGRNVFAEILEQTGEAGDTRLLDMVQKQYVFEDVALHYAPVLTMTRRATHNAGFQ